MDPETTFVLVRTNKSRGGGDDDYDVCDGEKGHWSDRAPPTSAEERALVLDDHCRRPQAIIVRSRVCRLAASKQWRNFGRNGPATTLFAIASSTFQTHRCPRLSLVAFGATPKFGLP